jgi:hypothetical protein
VDAHGRPPESQDRMGCDACWPESSADAWDARGDLADGAWLVDDSHFIVRLLTCDRCGQRFVSVFFEIVDWVDGDDSQYWTLLPITRQEADHLTQLGESVTAQVVRELAPGRRSLRRDYPKGEQPHVLWGVGVAV